MIASDFRIFLFWLFGCGIGSAAVGMGVHHFCHNLRIVFPVIAGAFVIMSRLFNWRYDHFLAVSSVETTRNNEGIKPLALPAPTTVRDLENSRPIYRFFQATVYLKDSSDAVLNLRSRELITVILTLILAAVLVGFAFNAVTAQTSATSLAPPNTVPSTNSGMPLTAIGSATPPAVPGGILQASIPFSASEIGWTVTLSLLPIIFHILNLWLPLLFIQLRNQKL